MKTVTFVHSCVVVSMMGQVSQVAQAQTDAVIGTWKLNVAKSKYDPGPAPKGSTLTLEVAGDGIKVVQTYTRVVSPDGKVLTITSKGTNSKGQQVHNVVVYDKQ